MSHGDEGVFIDLVDFVDGADVGMVECGGGLGLAREALSGLLVRHEMGGEEFECDGTFEFGVFGLIDHAHPAFTELLGDLVVADGLADHDWAIVPL